jgi:hypothetical protein
MSGTQLIETGLRRGAQIGNYRIVAPLTGGGMGLVYVAEHVLLGRKVAVKVLRPEISHVPGAVQRFFNEARATTTIRHPGIVEIFDFGYTPERLAYIVMEWLTGVTLAEGLSRERFSLVSALVVMRRVASALAAAHAQGIVHRDLKPDNVFLVADPEGGGIPQVKLLDFGIAKLLDEGAASPRQTATGVVMGTPVYMSPEQCRAAPCDHRADLYAFGCVLFEMVAGRPPFLANNTGELLAAHLMQAPASLDDVIPGTPPALVALVARLLAKTPEARPRDAASVATELDRLIATVAPARLSAERATVLAPAGGTPYPDVFTSPPVAASLLRATVAAQVPPSPRRWSRIALALALGGAGVAVTATALLRPRPPRPEPALDRTAPPPPPVPAPVAVPAPPVDAGVPDAAVPDAAVADAGIPDAAVEPRRSRPKKQPAIIDLDGVERELGTSISGRVLN